MKKLVLGTVLGGAVVFAWGAVSWMVLPWHRGMLHSFTNEVAMAKAVQQNAPQAGVYVLLPSHWQNPTPEQKAVPKGLMLFGAVRRDAPDLRVYYVRGLAVEMVGAFLVTWLLLMLPDLSYGARVKVVTMVALTAGALVRLSDWTWWSFSTQFTLLSILDLVIGWFLAGLVIANIAHRES